MLTPTNVSSMAVELPDTERLALAKQPFTVTKQLRYVPRPDADFDVGSLGAGAQQSAL